MKRTLRVAVVTGADSGLGAAIVEALNQNDFTEDVTLPIYGPDGGNPFGGDLTDPGVSYELAQWVRELTKDHMEMYECDEYYPVLVNCAGVNYIEWFPDADMSQFDRLMEINVKAGLMLIQNLLGPSQKPAIEDLTYGPLDWFNGTGAVLNIVSNASHVPMTNSAFYNASKGAFHIATLSLARELRKTHGTCVFGISPNKLSGTGMSSYIEDRVPALRGWTKQQAEAYQLAALPAGEETDPATLAEFIAFLLSSPERHKYLTGTILPYGA